MSLPKPKQNESKKDFIARCMNDSFMIKEYPDEEQRLAASSNLIENKSKLITKRKKTCSDSIVLFSSGIHEIFINKLNVGEYRYEEWNKEEYLVVPVIIIVEGVHNGFFYPAHNLKESVSNWEGVLVPIYHPENAEGEFVSAKDVEGECVGRFWNSQWNENKKGIVGEFWLIKNKLSEEVIEELINGDMEVSTGLYATHDFDNSGVWNEEAYIATLSGYEPDHVALLPGTLGACSWEDGCGVRVNMKNRKEDKNNTLEKEVTEENMIDKLKGLVSKIILFSNISDEDKQKYKEVYKNELTEIVINELSYEDLRFTLYQILQEAFKTPDDDYPDAYIRDIYDGYFVFERKGKLYSQNYSIDNDDNVTLGNEITEVKLKSKYVPISNEDDKSNNDEDVEDKEESQTKETQTNKEESMNKEELILALISNETSPFEESDKDFLMNKEEDALKNLLDKYSDNNDEEKEIEEDKDVLNKDEKISVDDYLTKTEMPEDVREALNESVEVTKAKKNSLIKKILSNEKNIFTKEELEAKKIKELTGMVSLMTSTVPEDKDEIDIDLENLDFSGNLNGYINKSTEISNERQEDGSGVPPVPVPKWNFDGTPDRSQFN